MRVKRESGLTSGFPDKIENKFKKYYYIENIETGKYLDWYSWSLTFNCIDNCRNWKFETHEEAIKYINNNINFFKKPVIIKEILIFL